jgi:excisionase family DNA binding protein
MGQARPFTPETLAVRWDVSPTTVRNLCQAGELAHFRLGRQYRIPAKTVEEIEQCQQTLASDVSEGDIASIGVATMANADGISLRHAPERKRNRKP